MSNLDILFKITEKNSDISNKILKALKPQVKAHFQKSFETVKDNLSNIVIEAIINAPEYIELVSGRLKAEFGLPNADARISEILDEWKKIKFKFNGIKQSGDNLVGSFILDMIPSDFTNVINLPSASFVTEKGDVLNWLEWLLLFGNKTIIKDYEVVLGPNPRSRTGMAVMRGVIGSKWRVPPEYSGTKNNNWITRAIDSADPQIEDLIKKSLKGEL